MLALFPGRDSSLQNGSATRSRSLRRSRTGLRPRIETLEEKLAPAVYVWTGAVDALMSNPANWTTAGAPASAAPDGDDDLVFSSAGAIKAVSNDLDNAAFQSVQFQDPGYVLSGHDFTLQNAISASQNATIAAGITLDPGPLNAFVAPWVQLKIEGALTGPGSLVKTGQGTLTLYAASSYAGATHLQAGMLLAGVANVLPASTALTVDDGAAFNLWNHDQRIGSLAGGTSNVDLGSATLTVGDATDTVYNGMLTGPGGSLVKVGSGSLTLTYFSTYNGPTRVAEGTLRIDGSIEPTPTLVVEAGATLSGRGSIGSILVAGTVIPGDASNRGSLFVKNATFLPGSRYMVNITGPNAGPSYGVLSVSGTADFSGATLQLASPYDGSPLTIVRNDGDIPFTTSFNGLADGSTLTVSGRSYLLDYNETVGDRAHDAVIRRATPTVALATSAAQVLPGQPVTFTANVGIPGGTAEGTVYFVDGSTVIGTAAIQGGQARFTTSTLGPGAHPIVAIYAHAQYGTAVSSPVNVAVNPVATTTRLAFTANSARTQLTFDAAVSAGSGTPSGVVLFYANGQLLQRVNVSNGHALMTVSSSSVLRKTVQAVFVPTGATYQGSGSPSVAITPQLISSSPIRAASTPTTVPSGPARRFVPRFRR